MAAREEPDAVADLVDAAAELTAAQEAAMAGKDAGALKAALPRMREQTGRVAALAAGIAAREDQTGSGSSPADIGARLGVLAGGTAAMALLRRGLLGVEDPGLVDPFAGSGPSPRTTAGAKGTATTKAPPTKRGGGSARRRPTTPTTPPPPTSRRSARRRPPPPASGPPPRRRSPRPSVRSPSARRRWPRHA